MILSLSPTKQIVRHKGQQCRIWKGTSDKGVPVLAMVAAVRVRKKSDRADFDRELIALCAEDENQRDFEEWAEHVLTDTAPKMKDSAYVMSLVPGNEPDVKFAVELGLSIMMDKPILGVVRPGSKVPKKLALVLDLIVEADETDPNFRQRLQVGMTEMLKIVEGKPT